MRRVTAILLGFGLIIGSGQASALHVHGYTDHDHPEHRHGPAAHDHHAPRAHTSERGARFENCDPSRHAIAILFACAAPAQPPAVDAGFVAPALACPESRIGQAVAIADVRVHGPPPRTPSVPRAPPLAIPA